LLILTLLALLHGLSTLTNKKVSKSVKEEHVLWVVVTVRANQLNIWKGDSGMEWNRRLLARRVKLE
jgi:hypothetical protein